MDPLDLTVFVLYPAALVVGLLAGGVLARALGRRIDPSNPPPRPSALAWTALWLGIASSVLFLLSVITGMFTVLGWLAPTGLQTLSIATAAAAVPAAITAIVRRDSRWPTWAALATAALPFFSAVGLLLSALISLVFGTGG